MSSAVVRRVYFKRVPWSSRADMWVACLWQSFLKDTEEKGPNPFINETWEVGELEVMDGWGGGAMMNFPNLRLWVLGAGCR